MTSPPSSPGAFAMPTSKPLRSCGPMEGFMPEMMMGAIDDSNVATYHDSNIEAEPDAGSDEVEER